MRITDEALDAFYGSYQRRSSGGHEIGVCHVCGEEIYEGDEHFISPEWDGRKLICADCVEYGDVLCDLFDEMDIWSKLECLGMDKVYGGLEG